MPFFLVWDTPRGFIPFIYSNNYSKDRIRRDLNRRTCTEQKEAPSSSIPEQGCLAELHRDAFFLLQAAK